MITRHKDRGTDKKKSSKNPIQSSRHPCRQTYTHSQRKYLTTFCVCAICVVCNKNNKYRKKERTGLNFITSQLFETFTSSSTSRQPSIHPSNQQSIYWYTIKVIEAAAAKKQIHATYLDAHT